MTGTAAKKWLGVLGCVGGLCVCSWIGSVMRPQFVTPSAFSTEDVAAAQNSIALTLMGQLQMSMFDLLWMKTLEYLHNGVAYRMPTVTEQKEGIHATSYGNVGSGLGHKDGPTIIPDKQHDWRGIVGDLNRQIMPYMTHVRHSDPRELIPWYRLAVLLDPHQARLYTMGAFFEADSAKEPDEARKLLEAGVRANPWSFEIQGALGRLYYEHYHNPAKAIPLLKNAIKLGKKERVYLAQQHSEFDSLQSNTFKNSYLFLARSLAKVGKYREGLAVCNQGLKECHYVLLRAEQRIIERKMKSAANLAKGVGKAA